MKEIIERGSVTLPAKDLLKYKTDCDSFMKDIGKLVSEDITIPSDNGYFLIFYSSEDEEEYTLEDHHNCFFNIYCDKNLNLSFYTKSSKVNIPRDMRYVIIKI